MLSFKIFGIPTRVHWIFWVMMALLGGIGQKDMTPEKLQGVIIIVGVGFVSIMVHELGHALTARRYGARPEIMLHGLGGVATYPGVPMTRNQRLQVIAAGPFYGLALGVAAWLVWRFVLPASFVPSYHLRVLFAALMWINFVWTFLNVLPILPLDGGQFLETWMRGDKRKLRGQIGTGVAAAVVIYGLLHGQFFMAVMFGFLAYQNFQMSEGKPMKRLF